MEIIFSSSSCSISTGCSENVAQLKGQENCLDSVCEKCNIDNSWVCVRFEAYIRTVFSRKHIVSLFSVGHYREKNKTCANKGFGQYFTNTLYHVFGAFSKRQTPQPEREETPRR